MLPSYGPKIVFPSLRNVLFGDSLREIGVGTKDGLRTRGTPNDVIGALGVRG